MEQKQLSVYEPGTKVKMKAENDVLIDGIINICHLCRNNTYYYNILVWEGTTQKFLDALEEDLVPHESSKRRTIGFKHHGHHQHN